MDTETTDTTQTTTPDPEAGSGNNKPDSGSDDKGKTFTQEEVERKLRGQGKKLQEALDKLSKIEEEKEAAERKRLEDEGKWKEIAERATAEAKAGSAAAAKLQAYEAQRMEALQKRAKALPADQRKLIVDGLNLDQLESLLPMLEKQAQGVTVNVHGGGGRGGNDPVNAVEQAKKAGSDWIHGKKGDKK
jgi:hypothetical protein